MTPEELKEIKERAEKATNGPWTAMFTFGSSDLPSEIIYETGRTMLIEGIEVPDNDHIFELHSQAKNPTPDIRFIAHARTDIPKLIEALEKAIKVIKIYAEHHMGADAREFLKEFEIGRME